MRLSKVVAVREGRWACRAAVAAAPAVGASRLLRPLQRQGRLAVPTHLISQQPVLTNLILSGKKAIYQSKLFISQPKPLYSYK